MLKIEYIEPQAMRSVAEPKPTPQPIPMKLIKLPAGFGCEEFYLAETPVTQAQWHAVMGGELPTQPDHPRVSLSYGDAKLFCDKASSTYGVTFRLPTELEWCRAVGVEPASEFLGDYAVFGQRELCAVKTKLPNEYGLYDMRGLVWEWLAGTEVVYRVVRGGSWNLNANFCRSAYRVNFHPAYVYDFFGFRVVVSAA